MGASGSAWLTRDQPHHLANAMARERPQRAGGRRDLHRRAHDLLAAGLLLLRSERGNAGLRPAAVRSAHDIQRLRLPRPVLQFPPPAALSGTVTAGSGFGGAFLSIRSVVAQY